MDWFHVPTRVACASSSTTISSLSFDIWHCRLGHVSHFGLNILARFGVLGHVSF